MQITITLDSGEDIGIAEILAAVAASYAKKVGRECGNLPQVRPTQQMGKTLVCDEALLQAVISQNEEAARSEFEGIIKGNVPASMADVPVPEVVVAMADNGAHSYTEGMTTPEVPSAPPAPPAPGVELDKSGRPWDASVHSSSHEKTVDGMWKFRRGLDPAIRNAYQAGQAVPEQPPEEAPEPPAAQVPTQPPAPVANPVAAAVAAWTFPRIMAEVTRRGLAQPTVLAVLKSVTGLNTLAELVAQPNAADLYVAFAAGLGL